MEVVLKENVAKLGQAYEVVKVKPGFARNYLFPLKKAVPATALMLAKAEKVQAERVKKVAELMANAKELATKLKAVTLTFSRKSKEGKLYGAIAPKDIVEALAHAEKIELDKKMVRIKKPIKTIGEHKVTLHLTEGVEVQMTVDVKEEA